MSAVVFALFTPSEAYKADINIVNEGMKLISACDGVLGNYHGISMESNNVGVTIELAASSEVFKKVMSNKELSDNIRSKMQLGRVGDIEHYHTSPVSDPKKALSGPVTEVLLATLKDPTPDNREAFEAIADSFTSVAEGKWTYGWSVEDSNKAIILAAWDSIEAHHARAQEPDVADSAMKLFTLIDANGGPFHFKLVEV